ncbi:MAG: hypothetical protein AB7H48_00490 [Parachlamydiales bacterium]
MPKSVSSSKRRTKAAIARRSEPSGRKLSGKKGAKLKKSPVKKAVPNEPARIVVKYDVGFNNTLSIRGNGAGLSWDRGAPLKNIGPDEWVWETSAPFTDCEFKVLINDQNYECGENHHLGPSSKFQYTPSFPQ